MFNNGFGNNNFNSASQNFRTGNIAGINKGPSSIAGVNKSPNNIGELIKCLLRTILLIM